MISMGDGLKVKAHRRYAAHRAFFMHALSNFVWIRGIKKARRYALGFPKVKTNGNFKYCIKRKLNK
jgi:3-deoxy-D-manno-octulosonic-acid transferase